MDDNSAALSRLLKMHTFDTAIDPILPLLGIYPNLTVSSSWRDTELSLFIWRY